MYGSNQPAQQQRIARILKISMGHGCLLYFPDSEFIKGADQTERECRLVCAFAVRIQRVFSAVTCLHDLKYSICKVSPKPSLLTTRLRINKPSAESLS